MDHTSKSMLSRRKFLRSAVVAGGAAYGGFQGSTTVAAPAIHVPSKHVLRVLGTHVTLQEQIRQRAMQDLGITVEFSPAGSAEVLHRGSTRATSFDLYEQWSNSIRVLWTARTIQPIDTSRLTHWDEINGLTKTGKLVDNARVGAGDSPDKIMFIQDDGTLGKTPTSRISFMPYVHNVDSFGYDAAVVPRGEPYQTESWAWLLDERWSGKVAIVNAPTIGLFDLALAVQAKGLDQFEDLGDLSRGELDRLFEILHDYREAGHFRGVWSSVPVSVRLMRRGETHIESMFSPAVFDLRSTGTQCVYASPREGYRAWHGVMCLSSAVEPATKDLAYEYMNWWLSGWPGAFIARQGYYISNPQRARNHMTTAEWDYWYEGKEAVEDLRGTNGSIVVRKGSRRDGGSYRKRFSNIAVWNTVMKNYEYTLAKWNEFLSA